MFVQFFCWLCLLLLEAVVTDKPLLFLSFLSMIDGGKKGQPVVPGASITRTSSGSRSSFDSSTQTSRFPWREKNDSDDEEWESPTGAAGRRRRSARLTPMSSKQIKSPEVVDMCDIDSDIEEVGAPEEPTVSWLMLFCGSACPLTYTRHSSNICTSRLNWS